MVIFLQVVLKILYIKFLIIKNIYSEMHKINLINKFNKFNSFLDIMTGNH